MSSGAPKDRRDALPHPPELSPRTLRVLLVEDDEVEARLVRHRLSSMPGTPVEVTVAADRASAEIAVRAPFDVCLLDYHLGTFTGIELLASLDVDALPGPVIMLTGDADRALDHLALRSGVADFLDKNELSPLVLERSIRYARRSFEDRKRLKFAAEHDMLTGLPNRATFIHRLQRLMDDETVDPAMMHVLYIDLDGFKTINDSLGHAVGDRVLSHVATQLRSALRTGDLMSRYGGDELVAAVISTSSDDDIGTIAEGVLAAIREPLTVRDGEVVTTASIGIASCRESPTDAEEVVRLADHAMFAAKRAGRGIIRPLPELLSTRHHKSALEADLRQALDVGELRMVFQPQFGMQSGRLVGAEALARWTHPLQGIIDPREFVTLATASGLIRPLTTWSLECGLDQIASMAGHLPPGFRLAINVAPAQMMRPGFAAAFERMLDTHDVPARLVRLEITEDFFSYNVGLEQLQHLQGLGVSLALDDFGTGYSCLAQLARLPVDTLKIDLGFIRHIAEDARSAGVVRSVLSIGSELGMTVIAEGVETTEQAAILESFGCEIAQGFLYADGEDAATFTDRVLRDSREVEAQLRLG